VKLISEGPPSYRGSASLRWTATKSACLSQPDNRLLAVLPPLPGIAHWLIETPKYAMAWPEGFSIESGSDPGDHIRFYLTGPAGRDDLPAGPCANRDVRRPRRARRRRPDGPRPADRRGRNADHRTGLRPRGRAVVAVSFSDQVRRDSVPAAHRPGTAGRRGEDQGRGGVHGVRPTAVTFICTADRRAATRSGREAGASWSCATRRLNPRRARKRLV
jgi:hypothetical protein